MKERMRVALLLSAAALVHGNTLHNGFAQDDEIYILQNHAVTGHALRELFAPNYFSHVFRPLSFVPFSCNWLVAGARPFGYHLVNLLLHAVVTVLVYLLLQYLLESSPQASTLAFTAALLLPYIPFTPKRSPASWAAPNCLRPDFFSRPGYCICATAIF